MRVQRLDLGVDIVVVPDQQLIILHPDLSFGQAMGAISATLPGMHPDAVVNLVAQVTQRPREHRAHRAPALLAAAPVLVLVLLTLTLLPSQPDTYGPRWQRAVAALGLDCHRDDDGRTRCDEANGTRYTVTSFARTDGALYVLRASGRQRYLRSFTADAIPAAWLKQNPHADAVHSSAALWE